MFRTQSSHRLRFRPLLAGALIAAAGLVGINGIAYAATGNNLVLGHNNHANKTTKITRTRSGPALSLHVKPSQPPLAVNSSKQVAHLNASLVGGMSAAALQTKDYHYSVPTTATGDTFALPGLPAGTYLASFDIVGSMSTSGALLNCVIEPTTGPAVLLGYGSAFLSYSTVSAASVVQAQPGQPLHLRCFTNTGTFTISNSPHIASVDFVKLDALASRSTTAAALHAAHARKAHGATGR